MVKTDNLIKQKNFGLLWTGKFVSQLGDKMYSIAMAWWILNISGSPGVMGLYMVAVTLPGILTGLISGVIIDRVNQKTILVMMDLIRGLFIGLLAILFITGQVMVWHVFIISIAVSMASSFFNPAVMTIIPGIIDEKSLHKANSFMQMIDGIATIAGPLLGAVSVSVIGYQGVILINAVSYLFSAFFELFITYTPKERHISKKVSGFFYELKEGYKFIISGRTLLPVMIYIFLGHLFIGAVLVMMPLIAEIPLINNIFFLGMMQVSFGSGYLLGALYISKRKALGNSMKKLQLFFMGIAFASILIGPVIIIVPISVYLVLLFFPVIGFSMVSASIYWRTTIQSDTPSDVLGRVSSVSSLMGDVTLPLSFAFYGLLFTKFQLPVVIFTSSLALALVILIINVSTTV